MSQSVLVILDLQSQIFHFYSLDKSNLRAPVYNDERYTDSVHGAVPDYAVGC
jgi:hypothetical protein